MVNNAGVVVNCSFSSKKIKLYTKHSGVHVKRFRIGKIVLNPLAGVTINYKKASIFKENI